MLLRFIKRFDIVFLALIFALVFVAPLAGWIDNPYYLALAKSTSSLLLVYATITIIDELWAIPLAAIELMLILLNFGISINNTETAWLVINQSTIQTYAGVAEFLIILFVSLWTIYDGRHTNHSDDNHRDRGHYRAILDSGGHA